MKASDIIKKTGKTDGKSNKEGGGGRFKQMEDKGMSAKLVAWIGRRKNGEGKMEKWSKAGKKRAEK
jgi:hypothetical protein